MSECLEYKKLSVDILEAKRKSGDLSALFCLGYRLLISMDKKAQQQGIALLQEAAEKGSSAAQVYLAISYKYTDIPPDKEHVLYWLNKAELQGDFRASYTLGKLYHSNEGKVVAQDYQKAFEYFKKSYEQGHLTSYFLMVRYMIKGKRGFFKRFKGVFSIYHLYKKLSFAVKNNQWEKELYEWDRVHESLRRIVNIFAYIHDVIDTTPPSLSDSPIPLQSPPQIAHFVGRTEQLTFLLNSLQPNQVMVLYGAEGIGKTALIGEMVSQLTINETQPPEHFPEGILFYSFSENASIESAMLHIAKTYSIKKQDESIQQTVQQALSKKTALLILDGVENITNEMLQSILEIKGRCGVLITSRDKQQIGAEANYQEIQALETSEAVTLLSQSTTVQIGNQKIAIQICEALGRLPLAIELAGHYLSQTNTSLNAYLQFLQENPQPKSIQGFLARIVAKLTDTEQQILSIFNCLALKPVPLFILEGVLELPPKQSKKAINSLTNFGLIRINKEGYELVYPYVCEQVVFSEQVFTRLVDWYKKFVEEETKKGQQGYHVLDKQFVHVYYLIEQAYQHQQWQAVIDLMWAIDDYLDIRNHWQEQKCILKLALSAAQVTKQRDTEGKILGNLGITYTELGELDKAIDFYQQTLAISQEKNDKKEEGEDLCNLGNAYTELGELDKAIDCYQQALAISREIGDREEEGSYLCCLGCIYNNKLNQTEKAIDFFQQALAISQETNDKQSAGTNLYNLGIIYKRLKKIEQALDFFQQAVNVSKEADNRLEEEIYLYTLGSTYQDLDDIDQAIDCYQQALVINQVLDVQEKEVDCLLRLGKIHKQLNELEKAIDYYQQALTISQDIGDRKREKNSLSHLGNTYIDLGRADGDLKQTEKAIDFYYQALMISQEVGDKEGQRINLNNLGATYEDLSQFMIARDYYQQALAIAEETHSPKAELLKEHLTRVSVCKKALKHLLILIAIVISVWLVI